MAGWYDGGMGEVRVRTKLINHLDEVRARYGEIASDRVRTYDANAMVDGGAVR